ncbi:MAG: bifunctional oligoribonuclease/PAP phosphatase NrnA [Lentisphaeria bacterium]|nr:bifunctional oligoribonuclease/PAP phosphatase NrnA [Lentisphaeria bacterium]
MAEISKDFCASVSSGKSFLIFTHVRPDGDALGSSFGLRDCLRVSGRAADVVIPYDMPDRYLNFFSGALKSASEAQLVACDRIIVLDCATSERIETGGAELEKYSSKLCNLDHHRGNTTEKISAFSYVDPDASSTCQLTAELTEKCGFPMPQSAATSLLIGMMTDTGNFRFSNTTGDTLRCAARLIDRGAELEKAVNTIYFSKSMRQRNFETDMIINAMKFAFDNRVAYAYITDEMLERHNFSLKEDEGIIDILREIDTVVISMLIHKKDGAYKLSMRSKDRRYPVGPVARLFGGGGHDLAAGATLNGESIKDVLDVILPEFQKLLGS